MASKQIIAEMASKEKIDMNMTLPITPIHLPRRGASGWIFLQMPWKRKSFTSLTQTMPVENCQPGGVWHEDVWLGWKVPQQPSASRACELAAGDDVKSAAADSESLASTSVA